MKAAVYLARRGAQYPQGAVAPAVPALLWPIAAALLLLTALATSSAWAQSASATLSATVTDETGAVLPGVEVSVRNVEDAFERRVVTDRLGSFTTPFLRPGRYAVTARREGFSSTELPNVVLSVNEQLAVAIVLKLPTTSESVTVIAEPSELDTSSSVGTVVDRRFVANMPLNGRSLHALLQLVPGVVVAPNSGGPTSGAQFSVNGQRATSNYFTVDGVSANNGMNAGSVLALAGTSGAGQAIGTTTLGGTNSLVSLDAVQEFRIETSSFAPEFGHSSGGQVSIVTRGGTNQFHGSAAEYVRHEAMDANDWFANSANQPKPKERQHLFGAVVGGPIRANRLFFFVSYEGLRLKQPKATITSVPDVDLRVQAALPLRPYLNASPMPNGPALGPGTAQFAASYSDPGSFDAAAVRLDVHAGHALSGFIRMNHAPSKSDTRLSGLSSIGHLNAANDAITTAATWVAAARMTADLRLNWTRNRTRQFSDLEAFGGAVVPGISDVFHAGRRPSTAESIFTGFGSSFIWGAGSDNTQRVLNVLGTLACIAGSHQLKVGVDYLRLLPIFTSGGTVYETLGVNTVQQAINAQASFYQISSGESAPRDATISSVSLYAQDAWQLGRRLTLNYGLRFEHVPTPSEASGRMPRTLLGLSGDVLDNPQLAPQGAPLWHSRTSEVAPRVGAAYQLGSRSGWESAIKAGAGIFYDVGLGNIASAFQVGYPFFALNPSTNVSFPLSSQVRTPPTLDSDPPTQLWLLDPSFQLPMTAQWNVTWEQRLGSAQKVSIGYVGASGRRLFVLQSYRGQIQEWPNNFVAIRLQRSLAESRYKALQLQYQRQVTEGIHVLGSYTLARSRDNASAGDDVFSPAGGQQVLSGEWGPSSFDIRHQLSVGITYDLPGYSRYAWLGAVSRDWGIDLLARAQSAPPFSPLGAGTIVLPGSGASYPVRPDAVLGQPLYLDDPAAPGGRRVNAGAFTAPPPNTQGNFPRNGLRAFPASELDLSVRRTFSLNARWKVQFRAELFNVLNHPNFGPPSTFIRDPLFGRSTQMLNRSLGGLNALYQIGGPRSGELAVKLQF